MTALCHTAHGVSPPAGWPAQRETAAGSASGHGVRGESARFFFFLICVCVCECVFLAL